MDREELEKKLEVTEELLEELYKLQKMLKKGTGPMAGLVRTDKFAEDINAQIRRLKAPFKKYGKQEISDSRKDVVINTREFTQFRNLPDYDLLATRGRHMLRYAEAKDNVQDLLPVYENIIDRAEMIRDELRLMKEKENG